MKDHVRAHLIGEVKDHVRVHPIGDGSTHHIGRTVGINILIQNRHLEDMPVKEDKPLRIIHQMDVVFEEGALEAHMSPLTTVSGMLIRIGEFQNFVKQACHPVPSFWRGSKMIAVSLVASLDIGTGIVRKIGMDDPQLLKETKAEHPALGWNLRTECPEFPPHP